MVEYLTFLSAVPIGRSKPANPREMHEATQELPRLRRRSALAQQRDGEAKVSEERDDGRVGEDRCHHAVVDGTEGSGEEKKAREAGKEPPKQGQGQQRLMPIHGCGSDGG